jgi:hypothetical protein
VQLALEIEMLNIAWKRRNRNEILGKVVFICENIMQSIPLKKSGSDDGKLCIRGFLKAIFFAKPN